MERKRYFGAEKIEAEAKARDWADKNGYVILKQEDFDYLQDAMYRLAKLDRMFKVKVFNGDGKVIALQG